MPIDFPTSPTNGQVYTYEGRSWIYNGTAWDAPRALNEVGAVRAFADAAGRTAAIPSPSEGTVSYLQDSNLLSIHDGASWTSSLPIGAWTAFTPTWSGGLTVGNGVYNTSHYALIGKTVHVAIDLTLGTTSAITGDIQLDVPTIIGRKNVQSTGSYYLFFFDVGVGNYAAVVIPSSGANTRFLLRYLAVGGAGPVGAATVSATLPFTWGNTDRISFGGTWEIA
jgi:hypothetical protein